MPATPPKKQPFLKIPMRTRLASAAASSAAAAILIVFVALNSAFVVNRGVCCADDSSFAVVAKNLASGFGYSLSVGYGGPEFSLNRFDPRLGTGPALILPVSVAVRVFGNQFWVPGAVHVTLWTLLLVAVWWVLRSLASAARTMVVSGIFLFLVYALSPYHFEQWYAMLGEVPAALLILLGFSIWAVNPQSCRRLFVTAALLALAFLTKILAFMYAGTLIAAVLAIHLSDLRRENARNMWMLVGASLSGFLLPVAAFELWKVGSLGPEGYLEHLEMVRQFLSWQAVNKEFSLAEITNRLIVFDTRFGTSLLSLLLLAIFGGYVSWSAGNDALRRLYLVLLAGVALHACYWLVLSIGWPRYFFTGLVLLCALVAMPFLALNRLVPSTLYAMSLALSLLGTLGRVQVPISDLDGRWFEQSESRVNQARVVRFLDQRVHQRPFVCQWWAPVADLEYLSRGVLNFKGYAALTAEDLTRGFLMVTNSRFHQSGDERFSALVDSCGAPVLAADPYAVYDCGSRLAPPP